jgi:hypothetical protein
MTKQKFIYLTLFTFILMVSTNLVIKAGIPIPPPPGGAAGTPLDPISWVLLGAGGVAAGKKYYDKRKEKNADNENQ